MRKFVALLFALLTVADIVSAGKDRPTPVPTSEFPSQQPTPGPSPLPTSRPSTPFPTVRPTTSPRPTTPLPTFAPTSSRVVVNLPLLEFSLQFSSGAALDQQVVKNVLDSFINDFLSKNAYQDSFRSLDMETTVQYDGSTGQATTSSVGKVSFASAISSSPPPTEEELVKVITTYLAFWGGKDLFNDLNAVGLLVESMQVTIDGTALDTQSNDGQGTGDPVQNPGLNPTKSSPNDNPAKTNAIIISVVVVFFFLLVVVFLVWYFYIRKKASAATHKHVPIGGSDIDAGTNEASSPKRGTSGSNERASSPRKYILGVDQSPSKLRPVSPPSISSGDEIRSYSGIVSVEESLFTTDDTAYAGRHSAQPPSSSSSAFHYDASRLDQVISAAKGLNVSAEKDGPV